jgi:hypothetical protein
MVTVGPEKSDGARTFSASGTVDVRCRTGLVQGVSSARAPVPAAQRFLALAIRWATALWTSGTLPLGEGCARFNRELRKFMIEPFADIAILCLLSATLLAATGLVWVITPPTR